MDISFKDSFSLDVIAGLYQKKQPTKLMSAKFEKNVSSKLYHDENKRPEDKQCRSR